MAHRIGKRLTFPELAECPEKERHKIIKKINFLRCVPVAKINIRRKR